MQAVIQQRLGYDCEVIPVGAAAMWQSVARAEADAMVAAWLPVTHAEYYDELSDRVVDLGPNLEAARIGLVVPAYVPVDSIADLPAHAERFERRIVGIDPGAGIMDKTEVALRAYGLDAFELVSSSGAAMTAQLGDAIRQERWILVTGWVPHWIFVRYDLKFLEDPKRVYGQTEKVHTIVRRSLRDDMPEVYATLDRFHWSMDQIGKLIDWNQQPGSDPYATAQRWVREHRELVDGWVAVEAGKGD